MVNITVDELREDHEGLRHAMRRFASLMERAADADEPTLLAERVAFSRTFARHLAAELACIGSMPVAGPGTSRARAIARYHAGIRSLQQAYSAHIHDWTPGVIEADRHGYVRAVLALQRRLTDQMAWEEQALLPLIGTMASH